MRIAIVPAATEMTASSRIRAFTLQKALVTLGHDTRLGAWDDAEVLLLQKSLCEDRLDLARLSNEQKRFTIFDIDDLGSSLVINGSLRSFYEMTRLAAVVTTDTQGHRAILEERYHLNGVEAIPDSVDYSPMKPVSAVRETDRLRVVWFGFGENLGLFYKYAPVLAALEGVQVVVVSAGAAQAVLQERFPAFECIPWSLRGFVDVLRRCDVACLMHDGSEIERAKSNNKMTTSITWGVPAVVSNTPEYARTAIEAGVPEVVFDCAEGLTAAIQRLRTARARMSYLERAQATIWRLYSASAVAGRFVEMCERRLASMDSDRRADGGWQRRSVRSLGISRARVSLPRRAAARLAFDWWRRRCGEPAKHLLKELAGDAVGFVKRKGSYALWRVIKAVLP